MPTIFYKSNDKIIVVIRMFFWSFVIDETSGF